MAAGNNEDVLLLEIGACWPYPRWDTPAPILVSKLWYCMHRGPEDKSSSPAIAIHHQQLRLSAKTRQQWGCEQVESCIRSRAVGENSRGAQDSNRSLPGNAWTTDAIPSNAGNFNVCGKPDVEDRNYGNILYINNNKHVQGRGWHVKVPRRTPVISVTNM